jgi:hypothetical protein
MEANPAGSGALLKMSRHRVRDLLLQVAEILPLRGDAACATRIIPPRHEPARLLVTLDLKGDFFHALNPLFHTFRAGPPPLWIPSAISLSRGNDPAARQGQAAPMKARALAAERTKQLLYPDRLSGIGQETWFGEPTL